MKIKVKLLTVTFLLCALTVSFGRVDPEVLKKRKQNAKIFGARMDCQPSNAQYDLAINNVRARLLAGGDMWWDLSEGSYIVPKPAPGNPEVSAIFASGLWIGGIDPNGALKLAGVTYRTGNTTDYYAGPLDENGQTDQITCNDWDRHFVVKGENIRTHIVNYEEAIKNGEEYPCESIPNDVKYWPARGNPFFNEEFGFQIPDQQMANFWDEDGDGLYNPCMGDYPIVSIRNCEPDPQIPDEIVYWTFNDNGGPHRLTQATPIQMEVHASAFAFKTLDEVNDMTFYNYRMVNKASDDIRDCYFGLWTDPDLGCHEDDFIGCNIDRSLAYVYNEDAVDGNPGSACPGGIATYGENIPMIGIDIFRGPRGPKVFCGFDEDGNVILCDPDPGSGEQDTIVELGMTSFTYHNRGISNPPPATTDPNIDFEFYNILQGKWKDGTPMSFGGSGFDPANADEIKYAFPDDPSDPMGWSQCTADLPFEDRRMVQATGPLLLQPGAKNEMIFGVVYVPDVNYPCPSIDRLNFVDDKAQALFDNCFSITVGPDAPDMAGVELDRELILLLSNDPLLINSNNANESFMEIDLMAPQGVDDPYYRFEGYKIYQLADLGVSLNELDNIDKARLLRQVDVKNGVTEIYNWFPIPNPDPNSTFPFFIPQRMVDGADEGIKHSFQIENDLFSTDTGQPLINGKDYYYTVIAYAYNNWQQYIPADNYGQRTPYLEGLRNVQVYTFSPRSLDDVDIPTEYGQEVGVTRIQGIGTSSNPLDMEEGERESILDGTFDGEITYRPGFSPINPKVVDPLGITDGKYRLEIVGDYNDSPSQLQFEEGATWRLTDINSGEVIASDQSIEQINEKIIQDRGFSIEVNQVGEPGDQTDERNGAIAQQFGYFDGNGQIWWDALTAVGGEYPFANTNVEDDPENKLVTIDDGQFIPFHSARWEGDPLNPYVTPGWKLSQGFATAQNKLKLEHLNNVDIILTPDKSKWSKCVVVEAAVPDYLDSGIGTIDGRTQFDLRGSQSIDQNGNTIEGVGMSYFPGYAIDVETGERLNIFFGENSVYNSDNDALVSQTTGLDINTGNIGSDMIWNPSTSVFAEPNSQTLGIYNDVLGGQHNIYVTRQEYDECATIKEDLDEGGLLNKINVVSFITWTGVPIPKETLLSIEEGLIPNEVIIRCRVNSPFNKEIDSPNLSNPTQFQAVEGLPVYEFGFEDVEIVGEVATEEVPNELKDIVVSPNPFYGGSQGVNTSNFVKVSNLPKGSIVTLYTLEGKFIRQFGSRNNKHFVERGELIDLEWNLGDTDGIELRSGMYIFHVIVPELGVQRSFKWIKS